MPGKAHFFLGRIKILTKVKTAYYSTQNAILSIIYLILSD